MLIDVDVANRAILAVGARGQIARSNEQSNEARYVRAFYPTTLTAMLRAAHWNFARKFAYLSQLKSTPGAPGNIAPGTQTWDPKTQPPPPWLFEYAYPADCVKMRFVSPQVISNAFVGTPISAVPSNIGIPFYQLQPQKWLEALDENLPTGKAKVVLANQYQAMSSYTVLVEEPGLWDPQFMQAFESALGSRLCIPLSGDKTMANMARNEAKEIVLSARITDGNEGLTFAPQTQRVPDWLAVRGYAADWGTSPDGYISSFGSASFLGI